LHCLEPLVELVGDQRGVLAQLVERLVRLVEDLPVFHHRAPFGRVASMPITSRAARPRYSAQIVTARARSGASAWTGMPPSKRIRGIRHASNAARIVCPPSRKPIG